MDCRDHCQYIECGHNWDLSNRRAQHTARAIKLQVRLKSPSGNTGCEIIELSAVCVDGTTISRRKSGYSIDHVYGISI